MNDKPTTSLSAFACAMILVTAFLGWMFSGVHMAINGVAMRNASADLLQTHFDTIGLSAESSAVSEPSVLTEFDSDGDGQLSLKEKADAREGTIGRWFGWLIGAFLFGAAAGGYLFGWLGDRFGRAKAMAASILCYSLFSAATVAVQEPWQLWLLRFVTSMGIGGMWPNGIALVSEAWPNISRPVLAGAIGTAANVGIMAFSLIAIFSVVTDEHWRWVMWYGASPALLGVFVLLAVPESPRWLAIKSGEGMATAPKTKITDVFRPPILKTTLVGIALGTVPLFGGWGSSNWANAWASQVGDKPNQKRQVIQQLTSDSSESSEAPGTMADGSSPDSPGDPVESKKNNPALKAKVVLSRSAPGSVSSLLGGALAIWLGRRRCYFFLSLGALVSAQILFWFNEPGTGWFLFWNASLGFFSGFFFGWLPLCLPEMFPTRVRAAGAGVSFNWGRIVTAIGVLVAAGLLNTVFHGSYAEIGRVTSLVYLLGMVVILFAPDTSKTNLND